MICLQKRPPTHLTQFMTDANLASFIWSVADLLRGDFKQPAYGRLIHPFTVLVRLDPIQHST